MLKKTYTFLSVTFVLLSIYSTGLSTISIADVLMIIMSIFLLMDMISKNKIKIVHSIVLTSLFLVFHLMIISFINQTINTDMFFRTLRFVSYLLFIGLFSKEYFDMRLGWKTLKLFSIISSLYLVIQYVLMNYLNIFLPGVIPGVPVTREGLKLLGDYFQLGYINRPRSFFEEPAHYSSFVLVYLGIALFKDYKNEKWWLLLISLGILLSGSSAGILTLFGLILWWSAKVFRKLVLNKNYVNLMGIVFILILLITLAINLNFLDIFINRTFVTGIAVDGRFGNYRSIIFLEETTNLQVLIGRGMKNFPDYLPALPRIYYYFGLIGVFTIITMGLRSLFRKQNYNKVVLVILIVSVFGTEILLGKFLLLYLPFIVNKNSDLPINKVS